MGNNFPPLIGKEIFFCGHERIDKTSVTIVEIIAIDEQRTINRIARETTKDENFYLIQLGTNKFIGRVSDISNSAL